MNDHILTVIGTVITVLSAVYAVYANRKTAKIVDYNREQSWEIYRLSTNVLGRFQNIEKIQVTDQDEIADIAKGEVLAQELVMGSIQMIKRFEENFTKRQINLWLAEGKIANETHLKPFLSLCQK